MAQDKRPIRTGRSRSGESEMQRKVAAAAQAAWRQLQGMSRSVSERGAAGAAAVKAASAIKDRRSICSASNETSAWRSAQKHFSRVMPPHCTASKGTSTRIAMVLRSGVHRVARH